MSMIGCGNGRPCTAVVLWPTDCNAGWAADFQSPCRSRYKEPVPALPVSGLPSPYLMNCSWLVEANVLEIQRVAVDAADRRGDPVGEIALFGYAAAP